MKKATKTAIGGVLTATLASSCCILPFIAGFIGLGAGTLGVFRKLEPYRPIFTLMAIGFLGYSFWKTYRAESECDPDGSCRTNSKTGKWNKVILWVATIVAFFTLIFPTLFNLFY